MQNASEVCDIHASFIQNKSVVKGHIFVMVGKPFESQTEVETCFYYMLMFKHLYAISQRTTISELKKAATNGPCGTQYTSQTGTTVLKKKKIKINNPKFIIIYVLFCLFWVEEDRKRKYYQTYTPIFFFRSDNNNNNTGGHGLVEPSTSSFSLYVFHSSREEQRKTNKQTKKALVIATGQ